MPEIMACVKKSVIYAHLLPKNQITYHVYFCR